MKKLHLCYLPVLIGAFGTATMGCLPTTEGELAKYNTVNYAPNADGSGFAGTWIITNNNDASAPMPPYSAYYARELVRLKPVVDTPDTYELTYCNLDPVITQTTVVASGNTITLPVGDNATYTITANGRMTAAVAVDDLTITWRGVRLSSNPDFGTGTVGADFASDGVPADKQPTVCFSELQTTADGISEYFLAAIGKNGDGYASALMMKQPSDTYIFGSDEPPFWFGNVFEGSALVNSIVSSTKTIRGTATTLGYSTDTGGSIVLDVTLQATP